MVYRLAHPCGNRCSGATLTEQLFVVKPTAHNLLVGHAPLRVRVAACITRGDELLLVVHEKANHRYWLLPGGGVEEGETMVDALRREILEETGFQVNVGSLIIVSEAIDPHEERHLLNMVFCADIVGGELLIGRDGRLCDVAWRSRASLPQLELYPAVADVLEEFWKGGFTGRVQVLGNVWRDAPS